MVGWKQINKEFSKHTLLLGCMDIGYDCFNSTIMVSFWKRTSGGQEAYGIVKNKILEEPGWMHWKSYRI